MDRIKQAFANYPIYVIAAIIVIVFSLLKVTEGIDNTHSDQIQQQYNKGYTDWIFGGVSNNYEIPL